MDGANGGLTLPQQVRAEWLADPVRAREWKSFLTRFDERYCQVSGAKIEGGAVTAVTTGAGAAADQRVPETKIGKMEDLKDVCQSLAGPSGSNIMLHIILVPEPQLWVSATGNDGCLDTRTPWCHGAGTWLVEAKAEKYLKDCLALSNSTVPVPFPSTLRL